jgi:hypothetical protein
MPTTATSTPKTALKEIFSPSQNAIGNTNKGLVADRVWAMPAGANLQQFSVE